MARYQAFDELDSKPQKKTRKTKGRRASLLGLLGVLVGLTAVLVAQRDRLNPILNDKGCPYTGVLWQVNQHEVQPYQIAATGAGLAVLALLLRSFTQRTRIGWPVLALLLSAGAAANYRYEHSPREPGSPERWVQDNVVEKVNTWVDQKLHPKSAADPAPVEVSTPVPEASPATAPSFPADAAPPIKVGEPATKSNNIFGL